MIAVSSVLLALWATSARADVADNGALGPFHFGMTVAEAQAAALTWEIRQNRLGIVQADVEAPIDGVTFSMRLQFERERLLNIQAYARTNVHDPATCTQTYNILLADLEQQFGVLDESPEDPTAALSTSPGGSLIATRRASLASSKIEPHVHISAATRGRCEFWIGAMGNDALWQQLSPPHQVPPDIAAATLIHARPQQTHGDFSYDRLYPEPANTLKLAGFVDMECLVLPTLELRCAVAREAPRGLMFGVSALREIGGFRAPATYQGQTTVGKRIHLAFPFTPVPGS
ncbi:MAG TPA: hypothetical protein VHC73_09570 [Vitreimonas sp.]|nr:hypothetical protein [Vitreimonas sp.]